MSNPKDVSVLVRVCSVCGDEFFPKRKTGTRCNPCIHKLTKDNQNRKLVDQQILGHWGRQHDIDSAIDLLTKLGYDVYGNVNDQFLDRCKTRYGISF